MNAKNIELSLRILVAEDNRINRLMISECLKRKGHTALLAEDGRQAVEMFTTTAPDVVLMDIIMPNMDGMEAARQIRDLPGGDTIPIVFLSALEDEASKVESLELADDFIAKPIEPALLMAKLSAFFRQVLAQRQLREQIAKSQATLAILEEETQMGAYVLERVLKTTRQPDDVVRYIVKPSTSFSGDLVMYEHTPDNKHIVLLADAIGHGIAAAFNVFPLIPVFTAMARKGLPLIDIIRQMNDKLRECMPIDRFVATALVCIDPHTMRMQVWNGGIPPVMVLDSNGRCKMQFDSDYLPLRLVDSNEITDQLQTYILDEQDEVLMFSDGFVEANRESAQVGLERIKSMLWFENEEKRYDKLVSTLDPTQSDLEYHDDVSIISIRASKLIIEN